jgi:hypothetical protein
MRGEQAVDKAAFDGYLVAFNAADYPTMRTYFADDMVMKFANGITVEGGDSAVEFFRHLRASVDERVEPTFMLMNEQHIALELNAEFHAFADFDPWPLKAGDVVRMTSFVHYDLTPEGRFQEIRIGDYRAPEGDANGNGR